MTAQRQRGFTLMELMVSMGILMLIIGAVFQLLSQSQSRSVSATNVEDVTAFSRDAMDQMVREIRLAGYPAPLSYPPGVITATTQQYITVAGGFLQASNYALQFEADLDNDGLVEVVNYRLEVPTGGAVGGCAGLTVNASLTSPTLMRSQVAKNANGNPVTPVYQPFVENVRNCQLATPAPIFIMCPAPPAAAVAGCPDMTRFRPSAVAAPANTRIVRLRLQVQTAVRDPQTGQFQNMEQFGVVERVNPDA